MWYFLTQHLIRNSSLELKIIFSFLLYIFQKMPIYIKLNKRA